MTDNEKLEELIREYSEKLMEIAPEYHFNRESVTPEERQAPAQEADIEMTTVTDTATNTDTSMPSVPNRELIPEVGEDAESFSYFTARVSTASGAYAVKNAKVVIYKDDVLHAFLVTDENGETKRIKLTSYPEINSFEPENPRQRVDYSADVFSEGFTPQKNLLISAVGGAEAVLNVALIPESEGVN